MAQQVALAAGAAAAGVLSLGLGVARRVAKPAGLDSVASSGIAGNGNGTGNSMPAALEIAARSSTAVPPSLASLVQASYTCHLVRVGDQLDLYSSMCALAERTAFCSAEDLAQRASVADASLLLIWLRAQVDAGLVDAGPRPDTFKPNSTTFLLADDDATRAEFSMVSNLTGRHRVFELIDSLHQIPVVLTENSGRGDEDEDALDLHKAEERLLLPFFRSTLQLQDFSDLPLEHGIDVADVGCRNGLSTIAFAQHFPGCRVTGYERSSAMLTRARDAARQASVFNVRFFDVRERPLDFGPPPPPARHAPSPNSSGAPNKKFHLVLSMNGILSVDCREVRSVLASPGGVWIILARSLSTPAEDLCTMRSGIQPLDKNEVLRKLREAGFTSVCESALQTTKMGVHPEFAYCIIRASA